MITHVVTFRWKPEVGDAEVDALCQDLAAFRSEVPAIRSYRFGRDLGLRPGTGDFAIIAQVDDEAGLAGYLDHPAHDRLLANRLAGMIKDRLAVQFAEPPTSSSGEAG